MRVPPALATEDHALAHNAKFEVIRLPDLVVNYSADFVGHRGFCEIGEAILQGCKVLWGPFVLPAWRYLTLK